MEILSTLPNTALIIFLVHKDNIEWTDTAIDEICEMHFIEDFEVKHDYIKLYSRKRDFTDFLTKAFTVREPTWLIYDRHDVYIEEGSYTWVPDRSMSVGDCRLEDNKIYSTFKGTLFWGYLNYKHQGIARFVRGDGTEYFQYQKVALKN